MGGVSYQYQWNVWHDTDGGDNSTWCVDFHHDFDGMGVTTRAMGCEPQVVLYIINSPQAWHHLCDKPRCC